MSGCVIIADMTHMYPISLVLAGKPVLVIGGGEVATRKVKGLLVSGAALTVVAPDVTPELKKLITHEKCRWLQKKYESTDCADAVLIFACTNSETVNTQVFEDASRQHIFVNVADVPELCTFYLPSVLRRGMLSIAVSTEGSSPLTARKIRKELEEQFDDAIEEYLALLHSWRTTVVTSLSAKKRTAFWQQATEGAVYELVKSGQTAKASQILSQLYISLKES